MSDAQEAASSAREALSVLASELADLRVNQAALVQRLEEIERDRQREARDRDRGPRRGGTPRQDDRATDEERDKRRSTKYSS